MSHSSVDAHVTLRAPNTILRAFVPKLSFRRLEHKLGLAEERCKKEIHPMADDKDDGDKIVFTDEQVAELKQAFALFDMDGSGEVSTDELGTVLETLGQKVTEEELVQIIAEVDQDGGGSVDFDEFVDLMSSRMSENNEEYDIIDVFKVFDQDGSGYITAAELRHVMMNLDEELTDQEIDDLILDADVDGDGQIGYDEFKRLIIHL